MLTAGLSILGLLLLAWVIGGAVQAYKDHPSNDPSNRKH